MYAVRGSTTKVAKHKGHPDEFLQAWGLKEKQKKERKNRENRESMSVCEEKEGYEKETRVLESIGHTLHGTQHYVELTWRRCMHRCVISSRAG